MNVSNMHIVLTGACGGIGQQSAIALANAGARIIAVGRDRTRLQRLIGKLPRYLAGNSEHSFLVADICDASQRQQLIERLQSGGYRPNVLINMAGTNQFKLFTDQQPHEVDHILNTNLGATMQLTRLMIPLLQEQPQALIVNIGSTLGSIGYPGYVSYCTTKFALRGFSEALSRELSDGHIRVQYFAPRATETALNSKAATDLNQALNNGVDSPDQVAKALLAFIQTQENNRYLGWPERLFVRINALFPSLVGQSIGKQLATVKRHLANESYEEASS